MTKERTAKDEHTHSFPRFETVIGEVIINRLVADPYWEMLIRAHEVASSAKAGQFCMVRCSPFFDPLVPRPMSIEWADPGEGTVRILYRIMGRGSSLLSRVSAGEKIQIVGPLGRKFSLPDAGAEVVVVGGGAGVAPLLMLTRDLVARGCPVIACVGASSGGVLLRTRELEDLGAKVLKATDDGTEGFAGTAYDCFHDLLQRMEGKPAAVYVCGPLPLMKAVAGECARLKTPCQVSLETYMGCGTGVCLGCVVSTRDGRLVRSCTDGPVFYADEVDLESLRE